MSQANRIDIWTSTGKNGKGNQYQPIVNDDGHTIISGEATAVTSGRKTVTTAGTAVQLDDAPCKRVLITAETDNNGIICVGDSAVVAAQGSQRGIPLYSGSTLDIEINNMNLLYIDSTVNGEGVTFIYIK